MKYGVYFAYWEKEWEVDYLSYIQKVAELGFDILEIGALGLITLSNDQLIQLKSEAEKYQIILTAGIGIPTEYDVSSLDEETRQRGVDFFKDILDKMHICGIHHIGGTIYSYWPVDYRKQIDKKAIRKKSLLSMKELADYAKSYDITLLVEVLNRFEQFLINDAQEALEYVKELNKSNVKIMLDTFHMNIEEDNLYAAIKRVGNHLGHLHVGESNRKVPGKGHLPWNEIGQALHEINYDGFVVMEPFVRMGGKIGEDIKVWRDLSNNATDEILNSELRESLLFLKEQFSK